MRAGRLPPFTRHTPPPPRFSGTSACPPYHLAIVIGGLSAEMTLKTVKMASTKYYDNLPTTGNAHGRAFRDVEMEKKVRPSPPPCVGYTAAALL